MIGPLSSIDQSPDHAQSLVFSGHTFRPSLLSSKGLSLPESHDKNAHHVVPCNPYLVPPTPQKDKLSHGTNMLFSCHPVHPGLTTSHLCRDKPLLAKAIWPIAKETCRTCAVPNRYIVHYRELLPKFLSKIDMLSDVLRESDLLQETLSDPSEYMLPETSVPIDSGYHSPKPTIPTHLDVYRGNRVPGLLIKFLVLSQKVKP